jgi:hypothetical protein
MNRPRRLAAFFLATVLACALAHAQENPNVQTLWKLVDKKGKVTYADKAPPKDYEGQVTRIDVDLRANRAVLSKAGDPASKATTMSLSAPELRRERAEAQLKVAKQNLEAARKAREDGKDPTEKELEWMGKVGGGARPVPTDAYNERIKKLDAAIKEAEEEQKRAEQEARKAAID